MIYRFFFPKFIRNLSASYTEMTLSKGELTRKRIISSAKELFNKEEKLLGFDALAFAMNENRSLITNHFPKKELLILAIYQEYETELLELYEDQNPTDLKELIVLFNSLLDIIYEYRFPLSYVLINPLKDESLIRHIDSTYKGNRERIFNRVESMVKSGFLKKTVLEPKKFDVLLFQYTNLAITWIISLKVYDKAIGYKKRKPVYIEGIMSCFKPYLTQKGEENFREGMELL